MQFKKEKSKFLALGMAFALTVSSVATVPNVTAEAASKSKTVVNQTQLDKALKNSKITKITIKTSKKANLKIKKGTYSSKTLVINAGKTTVTNAGKFKAVTITNAATVNETADKNKITVTDSKLSLNVKKGADKSAITLAKKNAALKLAADGKIASVTITKDAKLNLSGKSQVDKLTVNAEDTNITIGKDITVNNVTVKDNAASGSSMKSASQLGAGVTFYTKKIEIVNRGGIVKSLVLAAAAAVNMSGSSKNTTAIVNNAAGSDITTSCPASLTLNENADVEVAKGGSLKKLTINSEKADVKVADGASVANVEITKTDSDVAMDINGEVANIDVNAKANVSLSGSSDKTVAISAKAEGASVNTQLKVAVDASADVKVTLDAGAEGSKITVSSENTKVDVSNNSSEKVEVSTPSGNQSVESGKTDSVTNTPSNSDTNNGGASSGGSGSSGSGSGGDSGSNTPAEYTISYEISEQAGKLTGITADQLPADLPKTYTAQSSLNIKVPEETADYSYVWAVEGYAIDENGMVIYSRELVKDFGANFTLKLYAIAKSGDTTFNITYDMSALDDLNLEYDITDAAYYPTSYIYGKGTSAGNKDQIRTPDSYDNYYVVWESTPIGNSRPHTWVPGYYVGDVTLKAKVTETETISFTVTGEHFNCSGDFRPTDNGYVWVQPKSDRTTNTWLFADYGYTFTDDPESITITTADGTPIENIRVRLDEPDGNGCVSVAIIENVPCSESLNITINNVKPIDSTNTSN